jgi:hypothetical protein
VIVPLFSECHTGSVSNPVWPTAGWGSSYNLRFWRFSALFSKLTLVNGAAVAEYSKASDMWVLCCFSGFCQDTSAHLSQNLSLFCLPLVADSHMDTVIGSPRTPWAHDFSNLLGCSVSKLVCLRLFACNFCNLSSLPWKSVLFLKISRQVVWGH